MFFMQVGFAMLCAGSIREKNVKNVLLWNLLDSAGGAFGFWSVGFAFAYGSEDPSKGKTFVGNSNFFLSKGGIDMEFWCVIVPSGLVQFHMFFVNAPISIMKFLL